MIKHQQLPGEAGVFFCFVDWQNQTFFPACNIEHTRTASKQNTWNDFKLIKTLTNMNFTAVGTEGWESTGLT